MPRPLPVPSRAENEAEHTAGRPRPEAAEPQGPAAVPYGLGRRIQGPHGHGAHHERREDRPVYGDRFR